MKVLVVGNGFDLAHGLPTAYKHFMGVIKAVKALNKNIPEKVTFDTLFGELAQNDPFFIKTKALYDVDSIRFDADKIRKFARKIDDNIWVNYFEDKFNVVTWIDFEEEVLEALAVTVQFFDQVKVLLKQIEQLNDANKSVKDYANSVTKNKLFDDTDKSIKDYVNVVIKNRLSPIMKPKMQFLQVINDSHCVSDLFLRKEFADKAFSDKDIEHDYIDETAIFDFYKKQLNEFIEIFALYFSEIIAKFGQGKMQLPLALVGVDHVFSFNYTDTFQQFYNPQMLVKFIHGAVKDDRQNIVLGVNGDEPKMKNILKSYQIHGFTKYQQKLFNNTDYHFLEDEDYKNVYAKAQKEDENTVLEILIWGHSLAVSDQDYIKEMFSDMAHRQITVLYHSDSERSSQLNNLLDILKRETVETWMKAGKLRFIAQPDLQMVNCKDASRYIKLDLNGAEINDDATHWAAVKDKATGLIWAVDNIEEDERAKFKTLPVTANLTWFNPDPATNGGREGEWNNGHNTYVWLNNLNPQVWCGKSDWRLPSIDELKTLVLNRGSNCYCNDIFTEAHANQRYWSASPYAGDSNYAWSVYFGNGYSYNYGKYYNDCVRAVRSGHE